MLALSSINFYKHVISSTFHFHRGRVVEETDIQPPGEDDSKQAVRVEITGKGYYTATSKLIIEFDDMFSQDEGTATGG